MSRHSELLNDAENPCEVGKTKDDEHVGDFDDCQTSLHKNDLLQKSKDCAIVSAPPAVTVASTASSKKNSMCRFNGHFQPEITKGTFVGVSELWFSNYDIFGLTVWDSEELRIKIDDFCDESLDSLLLQLEVLPGKACFICFKPFLFYFAINRKAISPQTTRAGWRRSASRPTGSTISSTTGLDSLLWIPTMTLPRSTSFVMMRTASSSGSPTKLATCRCRGP